MVDVIIGMATQLNSDLQRALTDSALTHSSIDSFLSIGPNDCYVRLLCWWIHYQGWREMCAWYKVLYVLCRLWGNHSGAHQSLVYIAPLEFDCAVRGRPRIRLTEDMLIHFLSNRFTIRQMAALLQVSQSTIRRRLNEFGLSVRTQYSNVNDDDLDDLVRELNLCFPNCGYHLMQGHLAALGFRIQQLRIRESLMRIDPEGVLSRWMHTVQRRTYSVPAPNSLWHIDGNHRLIRYIY